MTAPDPVQVIRTLRGDLRRSYPLRNAEDLAQWIGWLVTNGMKEYRIIIEDEAFLHRLQAPSPVAGVSWLQWVVYRARPDVQQVHPLPQDRSGFVQWFYWHGVFEHGLLPLLAREELAWLRADTFFGPRYAAVEPPPSPCPTEATMRPFGVNLIGYVFGQLGIGEDLRMTARALMAAGVPVALVDFPPGKEIPQNDRSLASFVVEEGPFAINLFCMTALEMLRFWCERGGRQFARRHTIGYWPWELPRWPRPWLPALALVDEVWASSRYIHEALAPVATKPVFVQPLAVEVTEAADTPRSAMRARFGLPAEATLFVFSFDLNSSMHRKNPQAALAAFLEAFPAGAPHWGPERVGLVIKTHRPRRRHPQWERLKRLAAEDARIHLVEETLDRSELLALYRACDVFVSLHRAEGFGRGIAEALLLGLQVITTGFSGNLDFCAGHPAVELVGYEPVPVRRGQYPFGAGQWWAEPDVAQAAAAMRRAAERPRGTLRPAHEVPLVSIETTGANYRRRLEEIARQRGWAQ